MKEMTFVQHLEELRKSLIKIIIILVIGFFAAYALGEQIAEVLLNPLRTSLGDHGKIIYLGILDKVIIQFQLAFWAGLILTAPLWFYQIWVFLKPALYEKEIKMIRPFMVAGFLLFCLGVSFGYYIVFPFTFETLLNFGVQNIEANLSLRDYLVLATKVLFLLGFLFQLPNIMVILGFMEVVTKYSLSNMRRYIYVIFAIFSAMITPADVLTMMALWIPLVCLYEIGIVAVWLIVHPYLKNKYMNN
jgi:sec-independent protein translocase protein TatC